MATMRPYFAIALFIAAGLPAVAAADQAQSTSAAGERALSGEVDRRPDNGWFFYKDPKEEPRKTPKKPEPPKGGSGDGKPSHPVGSAAWLSENLDKLKEQAIDNPTKDNIELYAYAQKIAFDKAEVFATNYIRVMSSNPALDETITNPTSSFALRELDTKKDTERLAVLQSIAQSTAIWYFFRSDCQYCHRQNPLLMLLQQEAGFSVLPISLDGRPLQDGAFGDWQPDGGQAAYLGVTSTPTLFLVRPETRQVVSLAVGQRSLPDIERRIIEISRDQNWIDGPTYQKAMRGMPQRYLTDAFDATTIADPSDPAQVLKALRAAGMHGPAQQNANLDDMTKATNNNSNPWQGKDAP